MILFFRKWSWHRSRISCSHSKKKKGEKKEGGGGGVLPSFQFPWKCLQYHMKFTLGVKASKIQSNWEFSGLSISGFVWVLRGSDGLCGVRKIKKVWSVHGWVSEGWVILWLSSRFEHRGGQPGLPRAPQTLLSWVPSCRGCLGPGLKLTSVSQGSVPRRVTETLRGCLSQQLSTFSISFLVAELFFKTNRKSFWKKPAVLSWQMWSCWGWKYRWRDVRAHPLGTAQRPLTPEGSLEHGWSTRRPVLLKSVLWPEMSWFKTKLLGDLKLGKGDGVYVGPTGLRDGELVVRF